VSHSDLPDTCKFGHVFQVHDVDGDEGGPPNSGIRDKILNEEVWSLEDLESENGSIKLWTIMGDPYKTLKVSATSQGTPYIVSWTCADKLEEENDYHASKSAEDIFIAPQANLHQEFMQRKQQAEQRLNQTLGNLAERRQQKHLLEHDIRKLRSRVEALRSGDETRIKSDFIELVDGAGGGAQQGADEMPLKSLRDNNIYPSIVADFYEMEELDDLKTADQKEEENAEDGKLAHLPANEKAVLKKKWVLYEKWKDLYGSEIQRKLQDLKGQLKNVERSIQEVEDWVQPYVRDAQMINQETTDKLAEDMDFHPAVRGTASMKREIEFVLYKPIRNTGKKFEVNVPEEEATHFRIIVIHSVHVNLAGGEQPNSPANGPSAAKIFYYPAIVCKHVFENIIKPKTDYQKEKFRRMVEDYTGDIDASQGDEYKEAREDNEWSVRQLRKQIAEYIGEEPPLELSSFIRRIEDGLDEPEILREEFGGEYMEAYHDLLDLEREEEKRPDVYGDMERAVRRFLGETDPYDIPDGTDPLFSLKMELKFNYYYDYKLGLGLFTMK